MKQFIAQFKLKMCFILKEIIVCGCNIPFDLFEGIQFCLATLSRPG